MVGKNKSHSTEGTVQNQNFSGKALEYIFLYTNFFLYVFCGGLNYAYSKKNQVNLFRSTNMDVCGKPGHSVSEIKTD